MSLFLWLDLHADAIDATLAVAAVLTLMGLLSREWREGGAP